MTTLSPSPACSPNTHNIQHTTHVSCVMCYLCYVWQHDYFLLHKCIYPLWFSSKSSATSHQCSIVCRIIHTTTTKRHFCLQSACSVVVVGSPALQGGPPAEAAAELTRPRVGGRCSQSPQSGGTVAHILQHTGGRCKCCVVLHRFHNRFPQSRRRPLLGPSPCWKCLLALSHLRHY